MVCDLPSGGGPSVNSSLHMLTQSLEYILEKTQYLMNTLYMCRVSRRERQKQTSIRRLNSTSQTLIGRYRQENTDSER